MDQNEFKYFTMTAFDLLREGHGNGVGIDPSNRITLASSSAVSESGPLTTPAGMAIDNSGTLFIVDKTSGFIYFVCPQKSVPVRIPCIGGIGSEACKFRFSTSSDDRYKRIISPEIEISEDANDLPTFGAIAVSKQFIVISDTANHRVQCFFRQTLQISYIVDSEMFKRLGIPGQWDNFSPWDCVIDSFGDLYVIDINSKSLLRISYRGNHAVRMGVDELADPVSLFLDDSGTLYVLDRGNSAVLSKTAGPMGTWNKVISLSNITLNRPLGLAVDHRKTIYVGECGTKFHFWNSNGEYGGHLSNPFGYCLRLTSGPGTMIFSECTKNGIVRLNDEKFYVKEGYFFSKLFDGGEEMAYSSWHRITIDAILVKSTFLGVDYICDNNRRKLEKPWEIEESRWYCLFNLYGEDTASADALMSDVQGQYLTVRIRMGGDGNNTPRIRRIRISYPHESYLRYLPAVYQQDPISRDITDRFMSLFESFNLDMEEQIGSITRLLDPISTRADFLPWLASWLGIVQDENWPEERFRELLSRSYSLFKSRGTIQGLSDVISLYTGSNVKIVEHFRYLRPMVLGANVLVGMSTVVGKQFTLPLVLEETSTIGTFTLIEEYEPPETPFLADAFDFTVIIDAPDMTESMRTCLLRIIDQEKPAHTRYRIHFTKEGAPRIGSALIGIDTRMTHAHQPMEIGTDIVGTTTIIGTRHPTKGILGINSRIGINSFLQ